MSSEYVNVDEAVSRIGGNVNLYKKLLGRFVDGNHYDILESALQSGDTEGASHQAHSLKGVSANLSLSKIWSITVELEQLLKDGADCSSCMSELKEAFTSTLEKISEIMS